MPKITGIANMAPALQTIRVHINQMAANEHQIARDEKRNKTKPNWVTLVQRDGGTGQSSQNCREPCAEEFNPLAILVPRG